MAEVSVQSLLERVNKLELENKRLRAAITEHMSEMYGNVSRPVAHSVDSNLYAALVPRT